ncbi:hypothetical protein MA16_Dca016166 [Dendrobium catenatum]|uniref:Uncharacterized protein n=1 Tax=Dendrobium catenatum TaxID=906689 RepID=A0A2I0WBS1_9ASPA|nr:hypothetical protein MA16_Dca016166 [Dendrobium catenatum]
MKTTKWLARGRTRRYSSDPLRTLKYFPLWRLLRRRRRQLWGFACSVGGLCVDSRRWGFGCFWMVFGIRNGWGVWVGGELIVLLSVGDPVGFVLAGSGRRAASIVARAGQGQPGQERGQPGQMRIVGNTC